MEERQKLKNDKIEKMIYEVRGQLVMLDSDLAKLYGYKDGAKSINKSVMRHINYFTEKEYYQLSNNEWNNLRFQIGTSKTDLRSQSVTASSCGGRRYSPYVFTLEGIKILSTILRKSEVPLITSEIILAFENIKNKNGKSFAIPLNKGDRIEDMIYEIRGQQVMLDFDLARIYECKNGTKTINLAVKRHPNRFQNDMFFQLTEEEFINLKFQFETSSWKEHGGTRKLPFAFNEIGVSALSTVLHTPVADVVSSNIIRAFVTMRRFIGNNLLEQNYINNLVLKHDKRIETLEENFKKFDEKKSDEVVFFAGQLFDAYSKITDIMSAAQEELIIIDGYADKKVLDMISKLKTKVILIIKEKGKLTDLDIEEYNKQYSNLTIIRNDESHDRYFILDRQIFYHCGASINHAGSRIFSITRMKDEIVYTSLLKKIETIIKSSS